MKEVGMSSAAVALNVKPGAAPVRPKILAVDNHRENLVVLESILASTGAQVVCVESGPEALTRLESERFAVVLLDVAMPGMDGFEVAREIQAAHPEANIPVIFVTAYP